MISVKLRVSFVSVFPLHCSDSSILQVSVSAFVYAKSGKSDGKLRLRHRHFGSEKEVEADRCKAESISFEEDFYLDR